MALGTLVGGWRIVHTVGSKITRLTPVQGCCASTGGAIMLFVATFLGIPVSTTHTVTGSIIGVGAARKVGRALERREQHRDRMGRHPAGRRPDGGAVLRPGWSDSVTTKLAPNLQLRRFSLGGSLCPSGHFPSVLDRRQAET